MALSEAKMRKIRRECADAQREMLAAERAAWIAALDPRDWRMDGRAIGGHQLKMWAALDWTRAWMDMGPSIAGNLGPYWHVPCTLDSEDETVHRLYPRLPAKWMAAVRQAVGEAQGFVGPKAVGGAKGRERRSRKGKIDGI
jgi:hypothetical protein